MTATLFLAALCAAAYLVLTTRPPGLLRSLVKTASVALLALAAGLAGGPTLLVLALALCAVGDWLLSRETETAFVAGVGAFALGHLGYVALFLTRAEADPALLGQPPRLAILVALALFGGGVTARLAPRAGDLRGPVLAYVPVIIAMGIAALTLPFEGRLALVLPAALSFILSDLVLAAEKFLLPPGHPALRITSHVIWLFYWGAQAGFLIAFT